MTPEEIRRRAEEAARMSRRKSVSATEIRDFVERAIAEALAESEKRAEAAEVERDDARKIAQVERAKRLAAEALATVRAEADERTRLWKALAKAQDQRGWLRKARLDAARAALKAAVKTLPESYKGMRFTSCYHCGTTSHVKSGACWTAKQAQRIGKEAVWHEIPSSP